MLMAVRRRERELGKERDRGVRLGSGRGRLRGRVFILFSIRGFFFSFFWAPSLSNLLFFFFS